MDEAKIRLSPEELTLVQDANLILTKNRILQKTQLLLEELGRSQEEVLNPFSKSLPTGLFLKRAKVSKGENYQGLPWLMLDHPRLFEGNDVLAIRTLFWWGHLFSVTLHLSGKYKIESERQLIQHFAEMGKQEIHCCINEDPWQHHFEENNYRSVTLFTEKEFATAIRSREFVKLSRKRSLADWPAKHAELLGDFEFFLSLLSSSVHS